MSQNRKRNSRQNQQMANLDENYFSTLVQTSDDLLNKRILKKTAHGVEVNKKIQAEQNEIKDLIEQKVQQEKLLMEAKIEFLVKSAAVQKLNNQLVVFQKSFNDIVDPFNEARDFVAKNRDAYQEVAKEFNEENKKLDDYQDELDLKAAEMEPLIDELSTSLDHHHESLESTSGCLASKNDELELTSGKRQALESKLMEEVDVSDIERELERVQLEFKDGQVELEELRKEKVQTEDDVKSLKAEQQNAEDSLKSMQVQVEGVAAEGRVLDQRVANEEKILGEFAVTKLKNLSQRIEKANFNMSEELRKMFELEDENDSAYNEMNRQKDKLIASCQKMELALSEKIRIKDQLASELEELSGDHGELEKKKTHQKKKLEQLRKMKQEVQVEIFKTKQKYEKKLQKEKRRQALAGVVEEDEGGSCKSSDELESKQSSSGCDIGPIKKVSFEAESFERDNI